MYALRRTVKTYDGYDEDWSSDGKLKIRYYGEHEHELYFDGRWHCSPSDEHIFGYLKSSAVFAEAFENLKRYSLPCEKISELLPEKREDLYPAELLRLLLDDCGLELNDACRVVIAAFGEKIDLSIHDDLIAYQPRLAHLEHILCAALKGFAVHKPYDEAFRCPVGAVEDGTEVTLRLHCFGDVNCASAVIYGDGFERKIPMIKNGMDFSCVFSPEKPLSLRYRFELQNAECICPEDGFRLTVFKRGFTVPEWFRRRIMYQIFPDRFGFSDDGTAQRGIEYHKGLGQNPELHASISEPPRWTARDFEKDYYPDDFFGGTLKGIAGKLQYLKDLGIGVIYLNPVVESRSNHRYDTSDYMRVDPILGTNEDYVNLCGEAERLGIAIINDGVFSHTGADSIYFNRYGSYGKGGAYKDTASEYFGWYDFRHYPDDYRCWWDFAALPEVNELDTKWQEYIINGDDSVVKHWLRLGASGWRLDVADELPDEVLSLIRRSAKAEKPDCVIIGEVWEDAVTKVSYGKRRNYALGYSLDSVMNYPFRTAVTDFALGKTSSFELRELLLSQKNNYPKPMYYSLMNLLGSHDVERLHTLLSLGDALTGLDRKSQAELKLNDEQKEKGTLLQKLCAAIQYSVPGVPCLYYGDEECLDGLRDPFNRAAFTPSGSGLHNYYKRLAEIRNSECCMTDGDMELLTPTPDVLMIFRRHINACICCVINRSYEYFPVPFSDAVPLLNIDGDREVPPMSAEIYKFT